MFLPSSLLSLTVSQVPKQDYISSEIGGLSPCYFWRANCLSTEVGEGRRQKATTECPGILWLWLVCLLKMLFLIFWCVPWKRIWLRWWVLTFQVQVRYIRNRKDILVQLAHPSSCPRIDQSIQPWATGLPQLPWGTLFQSLIGFPCKSLSWC